MKYRLLTSLIMLCISVPGFGSDGPAKDSLKSLKTIDLTISPEAIIKLKIPYGDVHIEMSEGDQFKAELRIICPPTESECKHRMTEVQLNSDYKNEHLTLSTRNISSRDLKDAQFKYTIFIPKSRQLKISMRAGNLEINHLDTCLSVNLKAGNVNVLMSQDIFSRVDLDANVGNVSLITRKGSLQGKRRFLVGANLKWKEGQGDCRATLDVNTGNISMALE